MNYWLDLFTPYTWTRFKEHGATVSGFRPRQRTTAFQRLVPGDLMVCYLVKLSRWCGVLEVTSGAYEDTSPIFADENDPFPIRCQVKPIVMLDFEEAVPISELWSELSLTRDLAVGSVGWAQAAGMRQSLLNINADDGLLITRVLRAQLTQGRKYPLDADDMRHLRQRTVVRTEAGEVEVEVPTREDEVPAGNAPDIRESLKVQAKIAELGAILGFSIWVPASDRGTILELVPRNHHPRFASALPLNYDTATLKTIENIDVIWLERRAIAHAFEVEHTTAIYSGLLRMADLLTLQPRINISLHIVAPLERREQVRREIVRPVFSVLDGGPMSTRCSFLSYDAITKITQQPNLAHMRESIIEEFEEFFDAE